MMYVVTYETLSLFMQFKQMFVTAVCVLLLYQAVKLQKGEARRCFDSANLQGMGAAQKRAGGGR